MPFDFELRAGEDLPAGAFARLRAAGPVVWSEALAGWLVSGAAEVRIVLSDLARFTSAGTPVAEVFKGEGMLVNDTAMHHVIRAVWARHVSRPAMDARSADFARIAAAVLAAAQPGGGAPIDFMPLFRRMVLEVITLLFGVPQGDWPVIEHYAALSADTPALGYAEGSAAQRRHEAGKAAVYAMIDAQVAERRVRLARGEPPADLIARMVAAVGQNGITETVMRDNVFNFTLGAVDTTERWMGNALARLAANPADAAALRAEPARIEAYLDEVMRHDTVAQVIQRKVREGGATLGAQALAAGDSVYVLLGAASRDAAEHDAPDAFDAARPPRANFGFGFGFHYCLGLHIARAEVTALVAATLAAMPALELVACDLGPTWALLGPRRLVLRNHPAGANGRHAA
ncbi:MAG: cytochrome P450 [Sphingomonadales bacterium]|nr:cytochrome P450 [Sphingomonadales bacterium]